MDVLKKIFWNFSFRVFTEMQFQEYFRMSPSEVFLGKDVLKICSKFTGEYSCWSATSIKLLWKANAFMRHFTLVSKFHCIVFIEKDVSDSKSLIALVLINKIYHIFSELLLTEKEEFHCYLRLNSTSYYWSYINFYSVNTYTYFYIKDWLLHHILIFIFSFTISNPVNFEENWVSVPFSASMWPSSITVFQETRRSFASQKSNILFFSQKF